MSNQPDYYEVLGVPPDATKAMIQAAYRELMKKYHRDTLTGMRAELEKKGVDPDTIARLLVKEEQEAEEISRQVNEAYSVLSDQDKRYVYDASQKTSQPKSSKAGANASANSRPTGKPQLVVSPARVDLGKLKPGTVKVVRFTIKNLGDPLTGPLTITEWGNFKWVTGQEVMPDPLNTFPIQVEFKVDTTGLSEGAVQETFEILAAGTKTTFTINFEIRIPPQLVIKPEQIHLKPLVEGDSQQVRLVVENQGGSTQSPLEMRGFQGKPWFLNRTITTANQGQAFPKIVEFTLDTSQIESGEYEEDFHIGIDGKFSRVRLLFDVLPRPKTQLVLTPQVLNLNGLPRDSQQTTSFMVDYKGELPTGKLRIRDQQSIPWLRKLVVQPKYQGMEYPKTVSFTIDTTGMLPVQISETITVETDDASAKLSLNFFVTNATAPSKPWTTTATQIWWNSVPGFIGLLCLALFPTLMFIIKAQEARYYIYSFHQDFTGMAGGVVLGSVTAWVSFYIALVGNELGLRVIRVLIALGVVVIGSYIAVMSQLPPGSDRFLFWATTSLTASCSLLMFIGRISGLLLTRGVGRLVLHAISAILLALAMFVIVTTQGPDALKIGLGAGVLGTYLLGPLSIL